MMAADREALCVLFSTLGGSDSKALADLKQKAMKPGSLDDFAKDVRTQGMTLEALNSVKEQASRNVVEGQDS